MQNFNTKVYELNEKTRKQKIYYPFVGRILTFLILFIIFNLFNYNLKSDILKNKISFSIPSNYSNLNYLSDMKEDQSYVEAIQIYKDIVNNPENKLEEAISYNLKYLDNLSYNRILIAKKQDQKFTFKSFIDEKELYNLNILEEDKEKLIKNSEYIRKNDMEIKYTEDRLILLNSLDTLDNLIDIKVEDEVLSFANYKEDKGIMYLFYLLFIFYLIYMIALIFVTIFIY